MTGSPAASSDPFEPLRRHLREPAYDIDVGRGWWPLVLQCHQAVVDEFPEYELLAVKQKYASLAFQAFPRPWKPGGDWTDAEYERLRTLTDAYAERSESVCERCGAEGSQRTSGRIHLVLCDRCQALVPEHGRF
ncbi:hypothetical protein [Streptomyces niveus]|uniref:hypothetical protein n=1 Tax=Streptomyces niveus TaxID=193462 RepID=UPI003446A8BD